MSRRTSRARPAAAQPVQVPQIGLPLPAFEYRIRSIHVLYMNSNYSTSISIRMIPELPENGPECPPGRPAGCRVLLLRKPGRLRVCSDRELAVRRATPWLREDVISTPVAVDGLQINVLSTGVVKRPARRMLSERSSVSEMPLRVFLATPQSVSRCLKLAGR